LEGLVFGASVADFIGASHTGEELRERTSLQLETRRSSSPPEQNADAPITDAKQKESVANRAVQLLGQVRRIMWNHVGLVRTPMGLSTAVEALSDIQAEANELHELCPSLETSGVRDAACAGEGVAAASVANHQSAGTHYIVPDAPDDYSDDEDDAIAAAR
jgi:aspartate oxidase